ncbi:SLC13 family permease [Candidatus Hodarchaeum mangrovi]
MFNILSQESVNFETGILLTVLFLAVLILIASEKFNKVAITFSGVIIALIISMVTGVIDKFEIIYNWIDLPLILTIIGITLIMEMLQKSGIVEVFILYILRTIQGSFNVLMVILALSIFIMSAVMTNVLALVIISSITILIAEVAEFDAKPLLFLELVVANLAGMLTPIASYTSAYVSLTQGWSYFDFLILSLPFVGLMVGITIFFTRYFYRDIFKEISIKQHNFGRQLNRILQTIDPWSFVDSRKHFYRAIAIFLVISILLSIGTSFGLSVDIICLTGGMFVLIFFSNHIEEFLKKIDWSMIFFLTGVFIISGLIQDTNIAILLQTPMEDLFHFSPFFGILGFSYILGLLTSIIENIPLIFLLRPLIDLISQKIDPRIIWWSILAVVNITDSLFLISSVKGIYIMENAAKHGMALKFTDFLKYGVIITMIHLISMAFYIFFLLVVFQ